MKPMKRSRVVTLTILLAIIAAACDEEQHLKHCVDGNGVVVDEKNCANAPTSATPRPSDGGTNGGGGGGHFWYYGGASSPASPGTKITGGSYSPSAGKSYSPPSAGVSRGGFGGAGAAHGGGGGGSGGGS